MSAPAVRNHVPGTVPPPPDVWPRPDEIAPSDVQNPLTRKGWDMWNRLRGMRLFPAREQLSPRVLREVSRNIALVRVIDNGREFEFRVIGDAIVMVQGASHQGMSMTDLDREMPGAGKLLLNVYGRVAKTRRPVAFRGYLTQQCDGRVFCRESLILPLGKTDKAVDHILVILVYGANPAELLN